MSDSPEEKFRRHFEPLFNKMLAVAWRLTGAKADAEDLAQETFLKAFRSMERFDERQSAGAWLYSIMKNTFLNDIRSAKKREFVPFDEKLVERAEGIAVGSVDEMDGRLMAALDSLPKDMRAVLVAREVGELSYEEISEAMELPIGTVKSRINRARGMLKENWLNNFGEGEK